MKKGLSLKLTLVTVCLSSTHLIYANEFMHAGAEIEEYHYISK